MWKAKSTTIHAVKVVMGAKENATTKANVAMKATTITKLALEIAVHVAKIVVLV
jgi:hypothetical protein